MTNLPVTLRYPPPATLRHPEATPAGAASPVATQVYGQPLAPPAPASGIRPGSVIAEGYRVEGGPLGGSTGEGEVYRCKDLAGETVAVKLYRQSLEPKPEVIAELRGLAHPNIVRLLSVGSWQGCFYEAMEFCQGGALSDHMPFDEIKLRNLLPGILAGLEYCHRRGIIHRDIKPNNLFFPDAGRREVRIGDFGISSRVAPQEQTVRVTGTASRLTLDYAAPELIDGHQVGPKTDYYALGLSLLHLLTGSSPFQAMSPQDILVAHLRGRIPLPDHLTDRFANLIRGLLHFDPEARWGYREGMEWLHGVAVPVAPGRPLPGAKQPYPGHPAACTLKELAAALEKFDAATHLFRGDIRRWVFDHFDANLAEQIAALEKDYAKRPALALVRLRWLLDPRHPLPVAGRRLETIAELVAVLAQDHRLLIEAYNNLAIDNWIEAGQLAGPRTAALMEKIRSIRKRLEHSHETALFALLFTLAPDRPLKVLENQLVRQPADLPALYRRHGRTALPALQELVTNRRLEEWIRAAEFEGWEPLADFIEKQRRHYVETPLQATFCILWRLAPTLPFSLYGHRFTKAADLARWIDASPENTKKGLELLTQGWIRAWLIGSGQVQSAADLDQLILTLDMSWEAKLESLLRLLAPELPKPQMSVVPDSLLFGVVNEGEKRRRTLRISGIGRGHLFGHIVLERYGEGISLDSFRIEGAETEINITLDSLSLRPGYYRNNLLLKTNAGEMEVGIHYNVRAREDERDWLERLLE